MIDDTQNGSGLGHLNGVVERRGSIKYNKAGAKDAKADNMSDGTVQDG